MSELPKPSRLVEQGCSPVPQRLVVPSPDIMEVEIEMTFAEAINELLAGEKITRVDWENRNIYCYLDKITGQLRIMNKKECSWVIHKNDLLAEDWVVISKK